MSSPLILTATDRLARALREDLNLAERAAGRDARLTVWEAPQVRSLQQWVADVWADTWPSEQLLNGTQMQALWLDAVERDRRGVISASACAREAREAERLAQEYAITLDDLPAYSEEQRAWRSWRQGISRRMRERGWLSAEQLPQLVAAGLRASHIRAPAQVQLVGFESGVTPAARGVIDALNAVTQVKTQTAVDRRTAAIRGFRCADDAAQMRLVAELIRQRLAQHASDETLPPRIVVALPDVDGRRAQLEDALIERVAPNLRRPGNDDDTLVRAPWRWDAAAALSDSPWAAALQAIVAIDAADNPPEAATRLLLGAWFANAELHAAAAAIDLGLRQKGSLRIGLRGLAERARAPLQGILQRLTTVVENAPRRALPSAWSAHFAARLDAAAWPGIAALPSTVFQIVQELGRAITAVGALDAQTGAIDIGRARMWLNELLKRRFEPRAEHAQPVRLLAAGDAIGIACDLLIIVDADSGAFPGVARATPFLPIERQRESGVPAASPALWLAHRRAEITALLGGAREVVAIVPKRDARGGEILPSPLFETSWADAPSPSIFSMAEQLAAGGPHTQLPVADPVPPVSAAEKLSGNTQLFEQYLAAPFFAFCAQRLGIAALPEVGRGLPAQLQGMLMHAALAAFWDGLESRDALCALVPAARRARIEAVLGKLLREQLPERDYGHVLVRLEAARLADVLGAWLTLEAAREEDFQVIAHERRLEGELGGLKMRLRIDRIERADSSANRLRLIDYKTGAQVDPKGWREEQLAAPQLPLYAVLLADAPNEALDGAPIDDIAFGHVADGAPEFISWQRWSSKPKLRPPVAHAGDFASQVLAWRSALEAIVQGFLAGRAEFDFNSAAALRNEPLLALVGLIPSESDDDDRERQGTDA